MTESYGSVVGNDDDLEEVTLRNGGTGAVSWSGGFCATEVA